MDDTTFTVVVSHTFIDLQVRVQSKRHDNRSSINFKCYSNNFLNDGKSTQG